MAQTKFMVTATPDLRAARMAPGALGWAGAGWATMMWLPPDGSAGWWLAAMWMAALLWRWLRPAPTWTLAWLVQGWCCPASAPRMSDVAMGWMMGTLWWHAAGCLSGALPTELAVAVHLALMLAVGQWAHNWPVENKRWCATLAFAAMGLAPVWAPWIANPLWIGMGLLTLAWACEPTDEHGAHPRRERLFFLVVGPGGLVLILQLWPTHGPDAWWAAASALSLAAWIRRFFRARPTSLRISPFGGRT